MVAALDGAGRSPRILGLTATFINGALKEMEKKRAKLETLLQSTLICPHVTTHFESDRFIRVTWVHGGALTNQNDAIEARVRELIESVSTRPTGPVRAVKKVVSRCTVVFEELGSVALYFYIESVIVQQVSSGVPYICSLFNVWCASQAHVNNLTPVVLYGVVVAFAARSWTRPRSLQAWTLKARSRFRRS